MCQQSCLRRDYAICFCLLSYSDLLLGWLVRWFWLKEMACGELLLVIILVSILVACVEFTILCSGVLPLLLLYINIFLHRGVILLF